MAIESLNNLTGNFNTQSFDIDENGVTTQVGQKYDTGLNAKNVLEVDAGVQKNLINDLLNTPGISN